MNTRNLILVTILLILLPAVIASFPQSHIIYEMKESQIVFIQTFWTGLALVVGSIGVYSYIINSSKAISPELFVGLQGLKNSIKLHSDKYPYTVKLPFHVKNNGNLQINPSDINIEIIYPKKVSHKFIEGIITNSSEHLVPGHRPIYLSPETDLQVIGGPVVATIWPKRSTRIFVIELTFPKSGAYDFYYYFTTANGFYPRGIEVDENNEPTKNLGKISIVIEST